MVVAAFRNTHRPFWVFIHAPISTRATLATHGVIYLTNGGGAQAAEVVQSTNEGKLEPRTSGFPNVHLVKLSRPQQKTCSHSTDIRGRAGIAALSAPVSREVVVRVVCSGKLMSG